MRERERKNMEGKFEIEVSLTEGNEMSIHEILRTLYLIR